MKDQIRACLFSEGEAGLTTRELALRLGRPEPSMRRTLAEMQMTQTIHVGKFKFAGPKGKRQSVWVLGSAQTVSQSQSTAA